MIANPEANSGNRYRVAMYVDVQDGDALNPLEAAREAYANMEHAFGCGEPPIMEVTDLQTGEVTDIDLEKDGFEDADIE